MQIDLKNKKGLIVGIANKQSIAYGCASIMRGCGASIAATYLNEKAKQYTDPIFQELECPIIVACDVTKPGELERVFDRISKEWGKLDFLIHSIAFAPKEDLHGRVVDSSLAGFLSAMDVSCHSFIRMTKLAEPLFLANGGGSILSMSYYGSERVVKNYGIMGPAKAALECSARYMAAELGKSRIRVNIISPGPIATRAGSGILNFDQLLSKSKEKAPLGHEIFLDDIGGMAAFLVSDLGSNITGQVYYVDAGYRIMD